MTTIPASRFPLFAASMAVLAASLAVTLSALAAEGYRIIQSNRAFNMKTIAVALGDVVHFDNSDDFIHQIYIESPQFNFDSPESDPGHPTDVTFLNTGT